jgi:hypothetical protein
MKKYQLQLKKQILKSKKNNMLTSYKPEKDK